MSLKLNNYQKEAVNHLDGPCLVTSCPGSGKTFTLVERIVKLIKIGVKPKNILCLTFTNKAANEMKSRIVSRLGFDDPKLFVGTFHSMCVKLIRKVGYLKNYSSNFTIIDDKEQVELIMQISRKLGHELEYNDSFEIANRVNFYRDQMEEFDWVVDNLGSSAKIEIAREYIDKCRSDNIIDFSGLIYEAIQIIESDDDIKRKIQNTFKYILVDETQDTNKSQFYLVNLLAEKWRNIMLIGDVDQCVVEGQKILIPNGKTSLVEDIKEGDLVASASGGGKVDNNAVVNKVYKKFVENYDIVEITTKSGINVKFSKEHIIFADYTNDSNKKIVYLMYDSKYGYRIGVTNTQRRSGKTFGIGHRLSQERAECMWVLKSVDSIDDAKFWEHFYSIKYGIPTWCFYNSEYRNLDYSQGSIHKLFKEIDTFSNAEKLMRDMLLFKDRPHYVPKCICVNKRRNFTINMCADSREKVSHRYMISGSDDMDRKKIEDIGLKVRNAGKGKRGWRVDSAFRNLKDVYDILEKVKSVLDVNIIEKAKLSKASFNMIPSSHAREGMKIFVYNNNSIDIEEIVKVNFLKYTGNLYDFDINEYHNFITNGVVSHNSIYGWRGARYQNIQEFIEKYEDCKVISLSKNYRSTPQIVKAASKLIKKNSSHMGIAFETDNENGEAVKCYSFKDQLCEADWVGRMSKRLINEGGWDPNDIAVLYRANKMSEPVEQALVSNGIPYEVVGAWNFYDRKEIRDCLSMLKFLSNQKDGISFNRMCSLIPGLGSTTIGKIENLSQEKSITITEACKEISSSIRSVSINNACDKIYNLYNKKWDLNNPAVCLKEIIDEFGYKKYLSQKFDKNSSERIDNIEQLIDSAGEFKGPDALSRYLQQVSLVTNNDKNKDKDKENNVSLMSLHAAKGLEFPIVFMIGVEEDILPHKNSLAENPYDGLEEERRLCYVGMTRAKKILFVSWCKNRRRFGKFGAITKNNSKHSRFLEEAGIFKGE